MSAPSTPVVMTRVGDAVVVEALKVAVVMLVAVTAAGETVTVTAARAELSAGGVSVETGVAVAVGGTVDSALSGEGERSDDVIGGATSAADVGITSRSSDVISWQAPRTITSVQRIRIKYLTLEIVPDQTGIRLPALCTPHWSFICVRMRNRVSVANNFGRLDNGIRRYPGRSGLQQGLRSGKSGTGALQSVLCRRSALHGAEAPTANG